MATLLKPKFNLHKEMRFHADGCTLERIGYFLRDSERCTDKDMLLYSYS